MKAPSTFSFRIAGLARSTSRTAHIPGALLATALLTGLFPSGAAAQPVALVHDQLHKYVNSASDTAARSGNWSDPGTWARGAVPGERVRVAIPEGMTVTVDREIAASLEWIRVDGVLRFAPAANTALTANTVVVMHSGRLEMGTISQPITGRAVLTLSSYGRDFDHNVDPFELTRGLIGMGTVLVHGRQKTTWLPVSTAPVGGATRIKPESLPSGWETGDRLVLTASTWGQEEELTFERIENGQIVFREPLEHARVFPASGLAVHVGNFTRTAVIRSAPADAGNPARQAHVMLMSAPSTHDVRYVELRDLGRTTISPVTDPRILPDGTRDPSICPPYISAENIRGRYMLHFHNVGTDPAPNPHVVEGVAMWMQKHSRLKFGVINHSSRVFIRKSVSYNIDGSHFMTEEGNELGEFRDNLAIYSFGSNLANEDNPRTIHLQNGGCQELADRRRSDMGHNGSGFWVHSHGLDVIGNVAAGHTNAGFDMWTKGLDRPNAPPLILFPTKYLRAGAVWPTASTMMPANRVPGLYRDNVVYAAGFQRNGRKAGFAGEHGLQADKTPTVGKTLIENFLAWNVVQGVDTEYTSMTIWRNVRLIAGNREGSLGMGLRRQATGSSNEIHGATIVGFATCYQLGDAGTATNVQCLGGGGIPPVTPPTMPPPTPPFDVRIIR